MLSFPDLSVLTFPMLLMLTFSLNRVIPAVFFPHVSNTGKVAEFCLLHGLLTPVVEVIMRSGGSADNQTAYTSNVKLYVGHVTRHGTLIFLFSRLPEA